jgi:hypothetical protein
MESDESDSAIIRTSFVISARYRPPAFSCDAYAFEHCLHARADFALPLFVSGLMQGGVSVNGSEIEYSVVPQSVSGM